MPPAKYLTEKAAAKRLRVKPGTLANWRWRKYGPPYIKVGRKVEYHVDDIEAWKADQRKAAR